MQVTTEANAVREEVPEGRLAGLRARLRRDEGAVSTEMAIIVAVVVTIALAIGGLMANAANDYGDCIPEDAGNASTCSFADGN